MLAFQLSSEGFSFEEEYVFAEPRRWRFDFAFPADKIAVEIEGGIWSGGRHNRPAGFQADMLKYNTACLLGWRVFRFSPADVKDRTALETMRTLFSMLR